MHYSGTFAVYGLRLLFVSVCLALATLANAQTPAAGWSSVDVGPILAGQTGAATAGFSVRAAGSDIWGAADEFRFVYRPFQGDGVIVARVERLNYTDSWTKAGVMIRESLGASSKHAFMLLSGTQGLAFQRRPATGGATLHTSGGSVEGGAWVKLERQGSTFSAFLSSDGVNWTTVGTDTIPMNSTVYAGVALVSHTPLAYASADFTNVNVTDWSGWLSTDVGSVALAGLSSVTSGDMSITSAGRDIWDSSDEFRFVSRPLAGDGAIVARVASLRSTDVWTKAGVMIRESLAANSKHAFMLVSGGAGLAFQARTATGGATAHLPGAAWVAPAWVRLERKGSTVTGSQSSDGLNWTTVGTYTLSMSTASIGLAVTSHTPWAYATADFTNVTVTESASSASSWSSVDVGPIALTGVTSPTVNGFSVMAAGTDIWDASDEFRFVYQPLTGDGTVVARIDNFIEAEMWSKAGVMIRETLGAGSKHAFMLLSGGAGLAFQRRAATGGGTAHTPGVWGIAPVWVRLARQGTTITAAHSPDGVTWTIVGSATVAMAPTVYVGLAVTSHSPYAYATAAFSNVTVSAGPVTTLSEGNQPPTVSLVSPLNLASFWAPATIGITATASDPDGGVAVVEFYAGTTQIGSDNSSPYGMTWTGVPAGTYSLTAVVRDVSGAMTVSSERTIIVGNLNQPSKAMFAPSSNQATAVSHYVLDIFPAGANPAASNPVATQDLGLPPIVNGTCTADIGQLISGLAPGTYIAIVTAVGPSGSTPSAPSSPFAR
jgi:regulation of enolase protein 1 (concanavalin A-like superfamily)